MNKFTPLTKVSLDQCLLGLMFSRTNVSWTKLSLDKCLLDKSSNTKSSAILVMAQENCLSNIECVFILQKWLTKTFSDTKEEFLALFYKSETWIASNSD